LISSGILLGDFADHRERFRERKVFDAHQKPWRIPICVAAEAIKTLSLRIEDERGTAVIVKGAPRNQALAA
jgi:hypothetical protein